MGGKRPWGCALMDFSVADHGKTPCPEARLVARPFALSCHNIASPSRGAGPWSPPVPNHRKKERCASIGAASTALGVFAVQTER